MTQYMPLEHGPLAIDFSALDEATAQRNHGQTLTKLKERGGVSYSEAVALVKRARYENILTVDALIILSGAKK